MKAWLLKILNLLGRGRPRPAPADPSSLLGMYLSQSNSNRSLLLRHRGTQQRENGRFAQVRNRN